MRQEDVPESRRFAVCLETVKIAVNSADSWMRLVSAGSLVIPAEEASVSQNCDSSASSHTTPSSQRTQPATWTCTRLGSWQPSLSPPGSTAWPPRSRPAFEEIRGTTAGRPPHMTATGSLTLHRLVCRCIRACGSRAQIRCQAGPSTLRGLAATLLALMAVLAIMAVRLMFPPLPPPRRARAGARRGSRGSRGWGRHGSSTARCRDRVPSRSTAMCR